MVLDGGGHFSPAGIDGVHTLSCIIIVLDSTWPCRGRFPHITYSNLTAERGYSTSLRQGGMNSIPLWVTYRYWCQLPRKWNGYVIVTSHDTSSERAPASVEKKAPKQRAHRVFCGLPWPSQYLGYLFCWVRLMVRRTTPSCRPCMPVLHRFGKGSTTRKLSHAHLCLRFDFFVFCFMFFQRLRVAQKTSTSIHLFTPRPDYISQRPLLTHTHKTKALAFDTTKP